MLIFPCPQCGAKLQMSDDLAGKKVRCAGCEAVVTAPNTSEMIQSEAAPVKPKPSSPAVKSGAGDAAERDDTGADRPRRRAGNDAAVATAAAATGAGIGIVGILVAAFAALLGLGCCGAVLVALLVPAVQKVREAAARTQTINNMRQIALAEHNYNSTYQVLPPPKMPKLAQQNQPSELSWRVGLLPYIEQAPLYNRFDKNGTWDNGANRPLLSPMPMPYTDVLRDSKPGTTDTRMQYFTGPGTIWPDLSARRAIPGDFTAGTSNTILVAESANPVPWSKPADMAIQPGGPLPLPDDRFVAAFADGSARIIDRRRAPDAVLRQYLDPKNNAAHPPID